MSFNLQIPWVIFLVLHFYLVTLKNSTNVNRDFDLNIRLYEYTVSNRIFSNAWFLTMEDNSFAAVNSKKKKKKSTENDFIP